MKHRELSIAIACALYMQDPALDRFRAYDQWMSMFDAAQRHREG